MSWDSCLAKIYKSTRVFRRFASKPVHGDAVKHVVCNGHYHHTICIVQAVFNVFEQDMSQSTSGQISKKVVKQVGLFHNPKCSKGAGALSHAFGGDVVKLRAGGVGY